MGLTSLINTINNSLPPDTQGYLVGGFLRDSLAHRAPNDLDILIQGTRASLLPAILTNTDISSVFDDRKNNITKLTLKDSLCDSHLREIDIKFTKASIIDNLSERDFTINAMALNLSEYTPEFSQADLIDPFDGRLDILSKTVRMINPSIFKDNPIRLLRAVRLASSLKFKIDSDTGICIRQNSYLLRMSPAEAITFELLEILSNNNSKSHIEILDRLNLLEIIMPELLLGKQVSQPKEHYWDVWEHNLHCLEYAERLTLGHQNSPIYSMSPWTKEIEDHFDQSISTTHTRKTHLKLAALLHDIAKPMTKTIEESGRTRFPDHEIIGAEMSKHILTKLKLETVTVNYVSTLITHHLRPNHMQQGVEQPTDKAIYKYFNDLESEGIDVLFLHMADYLAAKGPQLSISDWATRAKIMSHVIDTYTQQLVEVSKTPKIIDGNNLMTELNIKPGPVIGKLLAQIHEQQALGEIITYEEALDSARNILNSIQGQQ